ncbi:Putative ribosomal RNA methyltransferase C4F10.03c [Verticillium dahliae VDG1]|nr:Putative ribosomal RNA methyltransferase C4F10.03c [Verticillium dahliae VDG1]
MKSWLPIPVSSHFSLKNIPFGIISTASNAHHRPAVAVGEHVLDLSAFTSGAGFSKLAPELQSNTSVFAQPTLNAFAALGRPYHRAIRQYLQDQWEYVPLGPFNAKNFGTSISAWVVLADALEPFRTRGLENETPLQAYLQEDRTDNILDVQLEVSVTTAKGHTTKLTKTSSKNLLWSWPQMLAHHTISGCNLRAGDLFGSGTVSGFDAGTHGSFLEQTQGGKVAIQLKGGEERKFVEDGDTITITGWAGSVEGELVGFGECVGQILPAVARS